MGVDDRIVFLVRKEVDKVLTEAAAGPDDLHAELHALATKVAGLEKQVSELKSQTVAAAPRSRTSKQAVAVTDEG